MTNREKLNAIAVSDGGKTLANIKWRVENRYWIKYSQVIALKILKALDEKGCSKELLAENLALPLETVNLWVRGSHNFTLQELVLVQRELGIEILK